MPNRDAQQRLTSWFRQWQQPLRRFLVNKRSVPAGDLDDVAQEVFLRLLRYERTELVKNPQAYLFRMASNLASEWALRARSRYPHESKWLLELTAELLPEEDAARDSLQAQMEQAVQRLPGRQRDVLRLHFSEDLGYAQIATRLGTTERVVKRQLARSYATLRRELELQTAGDLKHGSP